MRDDTIKFIEVKDFEPHYAMPCLVCDESVPLTEYEEAELVHSFRVQRKICDKCKDAILYMREQMSK